MTSLAPAPAPPTAALAPWGMMAVIDLHDAHRERLANPETIRMFVSEVVPAIGMVAHGPTLLERFGEGELEGWSAMQFIETSSLTIHADEFGGRCYIDVFSCKSFDPELAAAIAVRYFGGSPKLTVLHR
jgi:S-adenosylmethionine/arginine decarboxylase-like enzyme